jgi:hypothetical protein
MIRKIFNCISICFGLLDANAEVLPGDTCGFFPAPHAEPGNSFCTDDSFYDMAALATSGGDLYWYSDVNLTNLLSTGSYCTPLNIIGTTTYYVVAVEDECTSEAATVNVTIYPLPNVQISPLPPHGLYPDSTLILYSNFENNNNWSGPHDADSLVVTWPGEYVLTVTDEFGCTNHDTAFVAWIDTTTAHGMHPGIFVPNSFSPDGDGINDVFRATLHDVPFYCMRIFNRWGEAVFETYDVDEPWLGGDTHYNGSSIYIYQLEYGSLTERRSLVGTIILMH